MRPTRYLAYLYAKSKKETYKEEAGELERRYFYYLYKGLPPEQKEILEIIRRGPGMTSEEIGENMGIGDIKHLENVCRSMGHKHLVDVLASGKVTITPKGERALGS